LKKNIIIIGGGDHSKSILDIISRSKDSLNIIGYTDKKKTNLNLKYLGKDEVLSKYNKKNVNIINGIGLNIKLREKIFTKLNKKFIFYNVIDRSAIVSKTAKIEDGVVIFPLVHVGPNVKISKNVVIHTKASIEHDSVIEKNSYLGPNCTICGNVKVGRNVLIGGSSFLKENISIKDKIKISAGSILLTSFYKKSALIYGNPAKEQK
tara:strand:+ start:468 stop:1088 length:621 start_codon:yes stop_codon:yes gene_type:complete